MIDKKKIFSGYSSGFKLVFFIQVVFLAYLLLIPISSRAQGIRRQCIAALGSGVKTENIRIQQTIGQPYSTVPLYSSALSFRPGFHQPFFSGGRAQKNSAFRAMNVYPNPFVDFFTLEKPDDGDGLILFTDAYGHSMGGQIISGTKMNVNSEGWKKGVYVITLYKAGQLLYSTKVIKE